jgi:hypothetical protein
MKKSLLISFSAAALFLLAGCRTVVLQPNNEHEEGSRSTRSYRSDGNDNDERKYQSRTLLEDDGNSDAAAKQAVTYAANFVFKDDESHLAELTSDTPTEIKIDMKDALMDMQEDLLGGDDNVRTLSLDGVPATSIISDYADKALAALDTIKDYKVTEVTTVGDNKSVTVSLTPLTGVDSKLTGSERLRALKNFSAKSAAAPKTFTVQLDLERHGVEFDSDCFEDLATRSLS